jgi:tetratricopeptide (TPR) repeat protein
MGHLVHMPSHIYARVGDHESACTSNEAAVAIDREYFKKHPEGKGGFYEMMYYPHNIHFCAYANAWQGNYADAKKWADELYAHAAPHVPHMGMMEAFTVVRIGTDIKFRKWDAILASQSPDQKTMPLTTAMWHFGRGLAFAERGDVPQARSERDKMLAIKSSLPKDHMWGMLNKADHVLSIANRTIDAKIAAKENKIDDAEKLLNEAVALEDDLTYMEPPDWLNPSRETLGNLLLAAGKLDKAEQVYRADLERMPRNGPSLFGLMTTLKKQGRDYEAGIIERQFNAAWKNADTKLSIIN